MATADNLLNTTQNFLNPDFINKFSSTLGQPADKINIGLRSVIPTFLLALIKKGSSREGAEELVALAHSDGIEESSLPGNLNDPSYLRKGEDAINEIFGNKLISVTDSLGTRTGMSSSAITKIMSIIAPVIMGSIGKKVKNEDLTPNELMNYLGQQKTVLAGFSTEGLAGTKSGIANVTKTLKEATPTSPRNQIVTDYKKTSNKPWALIGVVTLLILGSLWWYLDKRTTTMTVGNPTISETAPGTSSSLNTALAPAAASLGELGNFLREGRVNELPKRFSFESLTFATGTTTLAEGSQSELDQIANTLKEFPNVTARIEGFTDNVGDSAQNVELSNARAIAVKEELKARGIEENRIEAIGRGQEAPIASNDTPEGRAQNRRIEFIVTNL